MRDAEKIYDTIIIGAGPAGLTASIYASRYKLSNLVIGKMLGGTITHAHKVENFPGVPNVSGAELGQKMVEQAKALGAEILTEEVVGIEKSVADGKFSSPRFSVRNDVKPCEQSSALANADSENFVSSLFKITTNTKKEFEAKTLIAALGTERRKLNVPGEKEYLGRGVSYCITCDAPFFKGKTVVLVGGSNAACSGAIHLANFAEKIYLIYRRNELRAEPVWVEEVKENPIIEVIYTTNLTEVLGDGVKVTGVKLDVPYNGNSMLSAGGVFVEIGGVPLSTLLIPLRVNLNEGNYVIVNDKMETNIPGLFAAGDFTTHGALLSQTITACADGAIAANSAFEYLKSKK